MKTRHIVLITDDNYCLPTEVCIQSIIQNMFNCTDNIYIHVCTFGLSEINVQKLMKLSTKKVVVSIDLFNIDDYSNRISQINQKTHVSPTALIKFELPTYFKNLDSLLYLDGDIIVKGNIEELLNLDLQDFYMAASFELWSYMNAVRYSFKRNVDFYFNSGVMLLNLRMMREHNITDKLWHYKLNMARTKLMDQESLNSICADKTIPLSIIWNFNPVFLDNDNIQAINKIYNTHYSNTIELMDDVRIIHYVGKMDKPWVYKNAQLREYWDKANNSLDNPEILLLEEYIVPNRSLYRKIKEKINAHGVLGTCIFILHKIQNINK